MNTCKTCAWYCHSDGKCYVPTTMDPWKVSEVQKKIGCMGWSFDGLADEEREEYALMAKETEHAAEYA